MEKKFLIAYISLLVVLLTGYFFYKHTNFLHGVLAVSKANVSSQQDVVKITEKEKSSQHEDSQNANSQDAENNILDIQSDQIPQGDIEQSNSETEEIVNQENSDAVLEAPKKATPKEDLSFHYAKLLISEIEPGGLSDDKEEFIELYNPNTVSVKLDGWYLQRKTASAENWSTFATKDLFTGKSISPKEYFLVAREGYYQDIVDVVEGNPITENNTFVLKNPKGEIVDQVLTTPNLEKGNSIGRKDDIREFEVQVLTPKAKNVTFFAKQEVVDTVNEDEESNSSVDPQPDEATAPDTDTPDIIQKNIIINEIQTAGATTLDEFIELYNPNNFTVDVTGYALKKKTSTGTESNLVSASSFTGSIQANGYFLIAPKDTSDGVKNYTGTKEPNTRYSGASFSIANNNTILLYDASGALKDKVGFGSASDFETTAAENPLAIKSIQRVDGLDTDNNAQDFKISENPSPGI